MVCLAALVSGCNNPGPAGPALEPRPETQTCLAGLAEMPSLLSDTQCFADLQALEPGPDLVPYDVNAALWTDGAFKQRYVVVPPSAQISLREDHFWEFPDGTVLIKIFGFEFVVGDPSSRRAVETRFMVRREGKWEFSSYRWTDDGADADLLAERTVVTYVIEDQAGVHDIDYVFPDNEGCVTCHGSDPGQALGPNTRQLNGLRDYGGFIENQLVAMDEIDLFGIEQELDPEALPHMPDPSQPEESLDARARAYLDVNCAHCHQPGGWAPSDVGLDLRYETSLEDSGLCELMRFFAWEGLPRIAPGDPVNSGLVQRFVLDDELRMPSSGSSIVDPFGTELLTDWIGQSMPCR